MLETGDILNLPQRTVSVIDFLARRRSNLAKSMAAPGPDAATLQTLLTIAARVPDHRKLAPWRFLVFEGASRKKIGEILGQVFRDQNLDITGERVQFEVERFTRAPTVIAVISSPMDCPRGTPKWEQILSAGSVCFNLCLAAQAHGFAAQWLSEWYAYDETVKAAMGLEPHEQVAGFIYIGTTSEVPTERARPDLPSRVDYWS